MTAVRRLSRGPRRGAWWRRLWGAGGTTIVMACPAGHLVQLVQHSISPEGIVEPDVACAELGCDFRDAVRLLDWVDLAVPA